MMWLLHGFGDVRKRALSAVSAFALLCCLSISLSAQDEAVDQEIADLTEAYAEIEQRLIEKSMELDRVLNLGYSGPALGKDLADIAEGVATLEGRLKDLGEQLAALVKKINYNPIKPFQLIAHKGDKDAPPLKGNIRPGDKVYLTAAIEYAVLAEDIQTRLNWALLLPDGTASEKLHKTEDIVRSGDGETYSFGIDTSGMGLGAYTMELTHSVVGNPKQQFKSSIKFTLAEVSDLKITKMVIDDERTGDVHQQVLPAGAFPYMFAYFEAPEYIKNLTANISVRDLTASKTIYQKAGVKKIKPDVEQQRFGVVLDPKKVRMTAGHEYRFDISLKDDLRGEAGQQRLKTAKGKATFFYGDEPKRIKIQKIGASNDAAAKSGLSNVPVSTTVYLSGWYKATRPVGNVNVLFRLMNVKDGQAVFEQQITHENQKDAEVGKVSLPLDVALLKEGAEYRLQTVFSGDGIDTVKSERQFTYAKLPPLDMRQFVNVAGNVSTPGKGSSQVEVSKSNPLTLSSKVSF